MNVQVKQRERVRGGSSHRQKPKTYSVEHSFMQNGQRTRICKDFFMGTLAIGHSTITEAIRGCSESGHFQGDDKRQTSSSE